MSAVCAVENLDRHVGMQPRHATCDFRSTRCIPVRLAGVTSDETDNGLE